ncbi:MAG: hypothetical protein CO093_02990 [Alphaproteobacteria bacterium CG_4_9_14_3_um_filter_47_13]|nr:MAG: hypothetical protein CO093_02990 [Alphaproteobacteria bacterium CG_4_9_14_3_um_filter_47_13]
MKKKIATLCSRTMLVFLEALAALTGFMFLIGGILIWRLMTGSVDASFAKDYIESALHDPVNGYSVSLEKVHVNWPDLRGPVQLSLSNVDLIKNNVTILEIENLSLGLATRYLFIGVIEPVTIVLQHPTLNLIRTEKNEIRLSLEENTQPEKIEESVEDEQEPLARIIALLSKPEKSVDRRSPLNKLQTLQIKEAKMVMTDYRLGVTWFLSPLDLRFSRDEQGLAVTANAEMSGTDNRISRVQTDIIYRRKQEDFIANIHLQDFDPRIVSRKIRKLSWFNDQNTMLNGNVELVFDTDFHIRKAAMSLSSMDGLLVLKEVYDAPLPYENILLEASYDEEQGIAAVQDLSIRTKGVTFSVSSTAKIDGEDYNIPVTIRIPNLPQDHISPLWPDSLREDGAAIWLTQHLSKGRLYDIVANFNVRAEKKEDLWALDVNRITGDFMLENMDIDYRKPLAPVMAAHGKGRFENDTLRIDLNDGMINGLTLEEGTVILDKIMEGNGHAKINTKLNGSLQNVLTFIEPEPIGMNEEKLGLKIADVKGQAQLDINVSFPTIKDLLAEQVVVKVDGTLDDVLLPDIVKTLDLTGGPLDLNVAGGAAQISGKAKLDGRNIDFKWKEYISPEGKDFASQVTAAFIADPGLRQSFGIGLEDWLEGSFPVSMTYTEYGNGKAVADIAASLTAGNLMIAPLNYKKKIGENGVATCKILFLNGLVQNVQNLAVKTARLQIDNAQFKFDTIKNETALRQGAIPRFSLDENKLSIDFEIGQSDLLKLSVKGRFFDARPFLGDKKKKEPRDGSPLIVSLNVDQMRTHTGQTVSKVKAYLNMNRKGDVDRFEMDAVAGNGAIYLRLKPDERGIMTIQLEADDAGAALKAFNMYENIKGGKLALSGEATGIHNRNLLKGYTELTDFHVVNAPVLAQLVSAISLFGIQQLLGGEGIYFSRLESNFQWVINPDGDQYVISNGRTSGSALGLTFDGKIDKSIDFIDIEGTIVPVSMVNELIGGIPLIGDILTGGGGGIIAATYKVQGPIKKPETSVNPLSALAPGILRTILFE